ncbi:MAG: hypothetical protein HYR64_02795 [Fimbriimonas ginsengisoli]|uniref:Uncharacterized protein n=1 Tax=Fimbriimonas ginsengisoli TaxID=1005039 RepID=A0A931PV91_FIMGI|nr:hypothetical protein [Fimbriimonas ginsengisoli]
MLRGCSAFVAVSLGAYLLSILPFFFWTESYRLLTLGRCALVGLAPAAVLGVVATRRAGLPGAAGFVASALVTAVFLHLRIGQMFIAWEARQAPEPDYPSSLGLSAPGASVALSICLALLVMPKGELPSSERPAKDA